jgi:hypothetical protein
MRAYAGDLHLQPVYMLTGSDIQAFTVIISESYVGCANLRLWFMVIHREINRSDSNTFR